MHSKTFDYAIIPIKGLTPTFDVLTVFVFPNLYLAHDFPINPCFKSTEKLHFWDDSCKRLNTDVLTTFFICSQTFIKINKETTILGPSLLHKSICFLIYNTP